MYSIELLNFTKSYMDKICVAWRKVMRRNYKLNYRTHSHIINNIGCTVEILLHRKTARYIHSLVNTHNEYISKVLPYFLLHSNSTSGENYKYLMYKFKNNDWYLY